MPIVSEKLWLMKKQLVTIGARPSQGKSSVAQNIAFDVAAQGKCVLFCTIEMTTMEVNERGFCWYSGVDNQHILKGRFDEYQKEYAEYTEFMDDKKLIVTEFGRNIREFHQGLDLITPVPDLVVIDHIGCIDGTKSELRDKIGHYLTQLRERAVNDDFCAIVCSQINRAANTDANKEPTVAHLKETADLEEKSDKVILLHYPYYYDQVNCARNDYTMILAKNRNGVVGKIPLRFVPEHYRFSDGTMSNADKTPEITRIETLFNGHAVQREEWT